MRAIGYVRVYTDQQADRGVSLQAQTERVKAMAIVQGADLVDIVVDGGESAKSMNRPGLQRILAMVEAGTVQAVIVAKLDRLTKREGHVLALELFEKRRVALISVAESLDTGSAAGRLVITIMGAVSQWEREAIGERTREALRHKGSKRERVGNIGYGLRVSADGVHVEECPRERGVLSEIQRLRSEGATMRGIAITLNTLGHRTRRGSDWRLESVARVLNNTAV